MPEEVKGIKGAILLAGSIAGAIVAVSTVWSLAGFPVPASRSWVKTELRPFYTDSTTLLHVRRQLSYTELFQWESNKEMNDNIRMNIQRIKDDIAAIDRELVLRGKE